MLASEIMNSVAALMNDTALTIFPFSSQIPYLNISLVELREIMESNNVPASNKTSAGITIATGVTRIDKTTTPALPSELLEIQGLYERAAGTTEDYIIVRKMEFLPHNDVLTSYLSYWSWSGQGVNFIGANQPREIKLDYIRDVGTPVVDGNSVISLDNCQSFLTYRTAALCSQFIGENETRAAELNNSAGAALDRFLNINTKGRQSIAVRRRPFMARFKTQGIR